MLLHLLGDDGRDSVEGGLHIDHIVEAVPDALATDQVSRRHSTQKFVYVTNT